MTDLDRARIAQDALRSGLVVRVRTVLGWSRHDLATRMNVLPSLVDQWEDGKAVPSTYASVRLWSVLVCAVRYEASTHAQNVLVRLP